MIAPSADDRADDGVRRRVDLPDRVAAEEVPVGKNNPSASTFRTSC
jgi:hypothetical protein